MKNKYRLLIIISIAAILPSVAVADVMITGTIQISGTTAIPPVHFELGSNYREAHDLGILTWTSSSGSSMGSLDIEGSSNTTIGLANVLDLNTSGESVDGAMVYLNLSGSNYFPAGMMYITNTPMTLAEVNGSSSFATGQLVGSLALTHSGSIHFTVKNPSEFHMVLYIGFYLPPGNYANTGFTLYVQYVDTGDSS